MKLNFGYTLAPMQTFFKRYGSITLKTFNIHFSGETSLENIRKSHTLKYS